MTVSAGAEAARGLSAEIKTDKNDYVSGDRADITLTMTNGGSDTLENVSGEIVLPEGMKLISGALTTESYVLAAGESREHKVTAVVEGSSSATSDVESTVSESSQGDTSSAASSKAADTAGSVNPSTGSRNAAPWIVLMLISTAGLIIIATKKKQGKRILSMFLCTAMCVSAFAAEFPQTASADSAESFDGLVITKDITVNGKKTTVTAKIKGSVSQSDDDTVTISFDSGDGTPVEPVTAIKGKEAGTLPQAYQAGRSFTGWYSDKGLTEPFYADTVVNEDTTLYASYVDSDDNFQLNKPSTYYAEDQSEKLAITLISDSEITADNLFDFISLRALTGEVPDKFIVTANGNEYTFIPESSYTAGCLYRMTVNDGVTIKGVGGEVTEYTFRIYKPESNILELNNEVKYLDKDKLIATDSEFEYIASKSYYNEQSLKVGDTVCLGDGTQKIDESVRFMNIVDIAEYSGEYYITLEDSDVDDVFDQVDISFKKDMTNEILSGGIDIQTLEQSLYSSEGVAQLNMIMAAVLAESDEVKDELGGVSLLANNDTDKTMTDFSENARLKEDALFDLSQKLGKDLSISVTIGDAENDNFGVCDPENWCAITFTLSYNSTIKNKLKVDASITITEYLNISLQGYKSFEFHLFKQSQLEFDYAINVYSQTDIGFKVLVCSTNKKNEKWRDISQEVQDMLNSDEENDTDSLVAQMQEMLSNQGDYITLCEIPMFKASQPLVPPITIFSVNLELNYVMKVNFAAGISSQLSVLDATQIGVCGDSSTGKFEGYKNKLIGADRYSFDLTACGYMGIKTGIEGSVTLSFFGLERLGKVGMALEVVAYLDIYGYAKYHIVKPEQYYDNVYRTLVGGFYMESGIYLELKLIAKSDVFKAKVEVALAEKKWPFFTMGSKEVLLSIDPTTTPIVLTSEKGEGKVKVKMEDLPAMTGTVLDITTGKKKDHAVISWGSMFMRFSHRGFTIEQVYSSERRGFDKYVQYNKAYDTSKNTVSAVAEIYYSGPYLQFTKGAAKGSNTVARVQIIWADATKIKPDEIGKMYTANFYSEVDGESVSDPEPAAIGSLVTIKDKFTAEGYDVSDWTAEGVTITEGKFTMPAGNVVFTATKTPKKYNVTVYVDGTEIADSPISADYNSTITLPEQPKREGYTFYWETSDGTLIPEGKYTIPAKDTEVNGIYTETTYKAYFYMEGEDEPYYVEENLVKGSEVQLIDGPRSEIDGQTFTGWYTTDAVAQYNNTYIIEDKDIRFTGKFVDINTCAAIIVMQTKDEEGNDIEFDLWQDFGGYGETITLPEVSRDGYMLYYYCSINGAYDRATNTITLPDRDSGNDFVMLYVSYSKLDPDEPLEG